MKIWIDGYEANVPDRVGSGQVAIELLRNLAELDKTNHYTTLLPSAPLPDLPPRRNSWGYRVLRPSKFWTRIALPLALFKTKSRPDIFFSPTHYVPRFAPSSVKRVVTIFDLAYEHFPEMFKKDDLWKLKNWTKYSIENADHIITISQSAKQDIINLYNVNEKKITVAYPGYRGDIFRPLKDQNKRLEILKKYQIQSNDRYIIYIGTIQPRKNLLRLMEAIKEIKDLKLVIVGKTKGQGRSGWMFEEIINYPKELGMEDRVIFTGFAPTEDLPFLLNGALAYILPSLYEGFGIPVVEAMSCGTPVIVSRISSLPEVVDNGKAGMMIDPYSVDDIRQGITKVVNNEKLRQELSKRGLEQAKRFEWQKMAKQVLTVFEGLA